MLAGSWTVPFAIVYRMLFVLSEGGSAFSTIR